MNGGKEENSNFSYFPQFKYTCYNLKIKEHLNKLIQKSILLQYS